MKKLASTTFFVRNVFFVTVVLSFFSIPVEYAGAKPKASNTETAILQEEPQGITLTPPKKERGAFSSISKSILDDVENGSPKNLRSALNLLSKDNDSYSPEEAILVNVVYYLLRLVWPSENIMFTPPQVSQANAYTGALDSARQGVYDLSTGNVDFLTITLPSVVLVTSDSKNDYYEDSEKALLEALSLKNDSVLANYLLGILYKRWEKYDKALPYLLKAYGLAPENLECGIALAQNYLKLDQKSQAYDQVKRLLVYNGQNKQVLKLAAETAYSNNDMPGAEQFVARVLQQEPDNSYFILFRAKILVAKGEYIKAAALLDVYARTDTKDRDYLVLRAKVQKDWNRNITAAVQTLEEALRLYPDDLEIVLASAQIASDTGSLIGGRKPGELVSHVLEKEPENLNALQIQIEEMVKNKDWNSAYRSSSNLIKLKNCPEEALYKHIEICVSAGKKDEAWKKVSELYAARPSDETVVQAYISVLVSLKKNAEATKLINQLLPSSSSKMKSFLYYEKSFVDSNEDAILADLRSSLTANPRNKDSLYRLYQIYFNKKEYRKAQYYLKQVVALSPSDESLLAKNRELSALLGN